MIRPCHSPARVNRRARALMPLALSSALGLILAAGCASAPSVDGAGAQPSVGIAGEATIAFASQGGIQNWQPQGDSAVLLQDRQGQWYLARLQGAATELPYTEQVGFDPGPSGSFGRLSTVLVKGVRYPVISLTRTDPPGKRQNQR